MKKQFYSHLVSFEIVRVDLNGLNLSEEEKKDLLHIAQKQMNQVMIDTALKRLSEENKKRFLVYINQEQHGKAWEILRENAKDIEKHFLDAAHHLYERLRQDIKELKASKNA